MCIVIEGPDLKEVNFNHIFKDQSIIIIISGGGGGGGGGIPGRPYPCMKPCSLISMAPPAQVPKVKD